MPPRPRAQKGVSKTTVATKREIRDTAATGGGGGKKGRPQSQSRQQSLRPVQPLDQPQPQSFAAGVSDRESSGFGLNEFSKENDHAAPAKRIFNPCCCSRGKCNLRIFCITIGVSYMICAPVHYFVFDIPNEQARDRFVEKYEANCTIELGNKTCQDMLNSIQVLIKVSWLPPVAFLLIGIFTIVATTAPKAWWAALAAAVLIVISFLLELIRTILALILVGKVQANVKKILDNSDPALILSKEKEKVEAVGKAASTALILILFVILGLDCWCTACLIQFMRQIRAGIDRLPTGSYNRTVQVAPGEAPKAVSKNAADTETVSVIPPPPPLEPLPPPSSTKKDSGSIR